jgi:hypothetical protein
VYSISSGPKRAGSNAPMRRSARVFSKFLSVLCWRVSFCDFTQLLKENCKGNHHIMRVVIVVAAGGFDG